MKVLAISQGHLLAWCSDKLARPQSLEAWTGSLTSLGLFWPYHLPHNSESFDCMDDYCLEMLVVLPLLVNFIWSACVLGEYVFSELF